MIREELTKMFTFVQRSEGDWGGGGVARGGKPSSHPDILGNPIPGRGNHLISWFLFSFFHCLFC